MSRSGSLLAKLRVHVSVRGAVGFTALQLKLVKVIDIINGNKHYEVVNLGSFVYLFGNSKYVFEIT